MNLNKSNIDFKMSNKEEEENKSVAEYTKFDDEPFQSLEESRKNKRRSPTPPRQEGKQGIDNKAFEKGNEEEEKENL